MSDLASKTCRDCHADDINPFDRPTADSYMSEVPKWSIKEESNHLLITRTFTLKEFKDAILFVNKVAKVAEEEGHHPNITVLYNVVTLDLWTHGINGLSESDFILASKIDKIV